MMVRREIFDRLGLFDERFFVWYGDWDLCKRAADAGWSTYYLKPAVAIHHERRSLARDIAMEEVRYKVDGWCSAVDQIRDRYMFLRKHASSATTFGVKAVNVAENLLRLGPMLASLMLEKAGSQKVSTQLTVTLQSLQAILKA